MKSNVGKTDKVIRVIIALLIAALGVYYKSWWGLVAIIPLATAMFSFCGLYTLLGINTCPVKEKEK
ncbi:MAG: DUF2892 domain-containing protein [Bacteroidales bacterium]|nr:DUF2892 domain-containing protein [Tenuifilaceae bacterium]